MLRFKELLAEKLADQDFRRFYEQECHVCCTTIRIIEKLHAEGISAETIAAQLGCEAGKLRDLEDADACDPKLVQRLCHHLGLTPPAACPRLD